mmetsp:Transcript_11406/g.38894  ORF Transcript_11406/g.38894 Transcript_11406/m.38894 type:complete len:333 (-) Transcript_11406:78-1076(-)
MPFGSTAACTAGLMGTPTAMGPCRGAAGVGGASVEKSTCSPDAEGVRIFSTPVGVSTPSGMCPTPLGPFTERLVMMWLRNMVAFWRSVELDARSSERSALKARPCLLICPGLPPMKAGSSTTSCSSTDSGDSGLAASRCRMRASSAGVGGACAAVCPDDGPPPGPRGNLGGRCMSDSSGRWPPIIALRLTMPRSRCSAATRGSSSSSSGLYGPSSASRCLNCCRSAEFQWFFTALSVRPGSNFAISAHLLPYRLWPSSRMASSSALHASFLMLSSSWLCHRSRHCLPLRPSKWEDIRVHCCVPKRLTRSRSLLSSSLLQDRRCDSCVGWSAR